MDKLKKLLKIIKFILGIINYIINNYESTDFEKIHKRLTKKK